MNILEWKEKYLAEDLVDEQELAECVLKDFQRSFEKTKVIIYGAGTLGTVMMKILNVLEVQPEVVIDRNYLKYDDFLGVPVKGLDALSTVALNKEEYHIFVAINNRLFGEVKATLVEYGFCEEQISSATAIQRVLRSSICTHNLYAGKELNIEDCFECAVFDNECKALWRHSQKLSGYQKSNKKLCSSLRSTGIIMGQVCTLKCKHCNESLPYFGENRIGFTPKETIIADIRKLASACDFLGYVELVGGEPFLHPEFKSVLLELLEINNIGLIHIFTNGTVVPGDEVCQILTNSRIVVYISNYENALSGRLEQNVLDMRAKLEKWKVTFKYGKNQNWLDFASFAEVNDTEAELAERYNNCFLRNCHRVFRGKLYGCPHHYGGVITKDIASKEDIVSLHEHSREELAEILNEWKAKDYIVACKQCKMPYRAETVSAAIQVE